MIDRLAFGISLCLSVQTVYATPHTVIELEEVSVQETKPNGHRWDVGFGMMSRPDLLVSFELNQEVLFVSKRSKNVFSSRFDQRSPPLKIDPDQTLVIRVIDRDLRADDLIDELRVPITMKEIREGKHFKLAGRSTRLLSFRLRAFVDVSHTVDETKGEVSAEGYPKVDEQSEVALPKGEDKVPRTSSSESERAPEAVSSEHQLDKTLQPVPTEAHHPQGQEAAKEE